MIHSLPTSCIIFNYSNNNAQILTCVNKGSEYINLGQMLSVIALRMLHPICSHLGQVEPATCRHGVGHDLMSMSSDQVEGGVLLTYGSNVRVCICLKNGK